MAALWLPVFSALLLQVNSYGLDFQQLKEASNSVYRAELPFNCPFHQEPASIGHLEDTVIGTIKQDGNFAFTKYPENLLANLNHLNKLEPIKDKIQSSLYTPDFSGQYEKPEFNFNKPQVSQGYEYNNDYQNSNQMASILPYYENDYQAYKPQYENDHTFSILPYFGNGHSNDNVFNGYGQNENNGISGDLSFSTLPYFESDHQYKNPSYVFDPESDVEESEEEDEQEQQNEYHKILGICVRNKVNIDLIYEGAEEEIVESEATIAKKSKTAMSTIEQLKLGKNPAEGPRIDNFKRGLFSSFFPKTPRSVISTASKSVSSGLNILSNPLEAINTLRKEVEANIPETSVLSQVANNIITRSPINQLAEQVKPKIEQFIQPLVVDNLEKDINTKDETKPELVKEIAAVDESPEIKSIIEDVEIVNQAESSENEQSDIQLKIEESFETAKSCINAADEVQGQLVGKVRKAISELYENAKEVHFDREEQLNMCAHSQFAFCQEEVDKLEENRTTFATNTNGELAVLTAGEDIHASTVNACVAQATAMLSYLQNVAADIKENSDDE